MSKVKNFAVNTTCKALGFTHLIGQTIADLSLNAEVSLRTSKDATPEQIKVVIDYRVQATMAYQAKLKVKNPYKAIADLVVADM